MAAACQQGNHLSVGASAAPLPIESVPVSKGAALEKFGTYRNSTLF